MEEAMGVGYAVDFLGGRVGRMRNLSLPRRYESRNEHIRDSPHAGIRRSRQTAIRTSSACTHWFTMKREDFINVAEEALDSLPEEFRSRIQNVAILVEDFPPNQSPAHPGQRRRLLLASFMAYQRRERASLIFPWDLLT